MPNRRYQAGTRWEREIIKFYEKDGAVCTRAAGSHSPFDVIAVYPANRVALIQCKVTKYEANAERLCRKFRENPPLPVGHYVQVLEVKITRKGRVGVVIDAAI